MKFIFMLLLLFLLTDPALAKPVNTTSECLNMYHNYMDEYGASRLIPKAQMLNFIGRCLPDGTANNRSDEPGYIDGTQHQKLLQNFSNNKIRTFRT